MAVPDLPPAVRFAPIVVHDHRERSSLASVAAAPVAVPGATGPRGPVAYARVRRRTIQYWLFYRDNPQDRGVLRTGRHEGDWEVVQVDLDDAGRPRQVTASQHSGAERCAWTAVERSGTRPVLYVANGSHATYFAPGTRDRTWPDPNDEHDGRGERARPRVVTVSERAPRWMAWPGRWGASRAGPVPGESDSPRGPSHQPRWADPDGFAARAASCHAGGDPPNRSEDALTLGAALAAAAALASAARRRSSRRRRGG
jgi:hypothetical protein